MSNLPELVGDVWIIERATSIRDCAYEISPKLSEEAVMGIVQARWWIDNKHMVIYKKWWKQLAAEISEVTVDQINFNYALLDATRDEIVNIPGGLQGRDPDDWIDDLTETVDAGFNKF